MPFLIYGTGGMGREAAQAVRDYALHSPHDDRLMAFVDDRATGTVHGVPVLTLEEAARQHPGASVILAVGDPTIRQRLAERIHAAGLADATFVHPSAQVGDCVTLGLGCYVAPSCVLTCDLMLGRQVQVNVGTFIHHDCLIGDYVTLSPRVTLCGGVQIAHGAFLGAGAVVKQGVKIGTGAVVGMGAVVTKDVPAGETWVGNPAKKLDRH